MAPATPNQHGALPTLKRRKHPAKGARLVAFAWSIATTIAITAALARADQPSLVGAAIAAGNATTGAAGATRSAATTTGLVDGVYTGTSEYTKWGNVQVQVTVQSGRVVSVQEVKAPSDGKSVRINAYAQPILEAEAIAAQSSKISAVSGATYTSATYTASLQAALDKATQTTAAAA
jgi:uncharacterized protein with FMN-binding domain